MNIILSIGKKSIQKLFAAVIFTAAISCAFTGCSGSRPPVTDEPAEWLTPTPTDIAGKPDQNGGQPDVAVLNNQYVVLWHQDVAPAQRQSLIASLNGFTIVSDFDEIYSLVKNDRLSTEEALAQLKALPGVVAADPDYILTSESFSNDVFADSQWALHNPGTYKYYFTTEATDPILLPIREDIDINFPEARDLYREIVPNPREVLIAVIDTGIDINHPELRDYIWTNPLEIPGDGIDNDGNGYIDDINGWDFFNSDNTLIHLEKDAAGAYLDNDTHGTQVAGIIAAASGNELGLSGAASFVPIKLIPLKINGGPNGLGSVSSAIKAINYATAIGADVCNMSWGSGSISSTLETLEAAMKASDMLFVCAAGNSGTDNDVYPIYPASIELPNNISVTFINEVGKLVEQTITSDGSIYGSNYGAASVDIAAPGTYILTTSPGGSYSAPSGSSMAAPFVSAVAAMLMSTQEHLYPAEIKDLILSTAKRVPADMVTPTPTVTPTPEGLEPTPTPDPNVTGTPSVTPKLTGTPSPAPTITVTPTAVPTEPTAGAVTSTPEITPGEPTPTPEPPEITITPVPTPVPVVTPEPIATETPTVTPVPSLTPVLTITPGAEITPTASPLPSETPEGGDSPTGTPAESEEPTAGPDDPTPTPDGPVNPLLTLTGQIRTPGIPDMYEALLHAASLTPDNDIPTVIISRTFDKSIILLDVWGDDIISGPRVIRYEKESATSSHTIDFFRRGIGGTAFSGPLKLARPGIYSFYVSDYAGNEFLLRYELEDDKTSPEIELFTTLKSPSGVTMAVLDVSDFESGVNSFVMLPGQHLASDFTAAGVKPTKLNPVDGRLLVRFTDNTVYTLYATDYRGNSATYEIKLVP